jgi:hypothetical protein
VRADGISINSDCWSPLRGVGPVSSIASAPRKESASYICTKLPAPVGAKWRLWAFTSGMHR